MSAISPVYTIRPSYTKDSPFREALERVVGIGLDVFDLIIIDEANKNRGKDWQSDSPLGLLQSSQILRNIDEIAIAKKRDVLFLQFFISKRRNLEELFSEPEYEEVETHQSRMAIIEWLNEQGIAFEECFCMGSGSILMPYYGDIYIDIPFEVTSENYQKLSIFLEDTSGKCKFYNKEFFHLTLDSAKKIHEERRNISE